MNHRSETTRSAVFVMSMSVILALAFTVPADGAASGERAEVRHSPTARAEAAVQPAADLWQVGVRKVRAPIPIKGRVRQATGRNKLVLQRHSVARNRWIRLASKQVSNGRYRFAPRHRRTPGTVAFRTALFSGGRAVAVSNVITVRVVPRSYRPTCANAPSPSTCPKPRSVVQRRAVAAPYCPHLTVANRNQTRTVEWRWSTASRRWVQAPTPWVTVSTSTRPAGAVECLKVVSQRPAGAALPDLRIKNLITCSPFDSQATSGTCFKIVVVGGKKLLKFGVTTSNLGAAASEIIADRSAAHATDWKAYQSFFDAQGGLLGSVAAPHVQFYFAGDGHDHWHVRDFDEYTLLDAGGITVARAEKHGYCMWDNDEYAPMQGQPGVPADPVYLGRTSCGNGLPNALTMIHGLSRGWGDIYPTSLPDQAIDVTGLPDGEYTVRVQADAVEAVAESNENNNTAQVKVQITGNAVTVVTGSSAGGH